MNKVFRVIWSEAHGAWVAVSEMTKSHSKRSRKSALAIALAAGSLMGASGYASAYSAGNTGAVGDESIAIGADIGTCSAADAAGTGSVSIGCAAGGGATGNGQINIGYQAGSGNEGNNNTALGSLAGQGVEGENNVAFGTNAGGAVVGGANTAIGNKTGSNVQGSSNTAFGDNSGDLVRGDNNLGLGASAGKSVRGDENISVGRNAGYQQRGNRNFTAGVGAGQGIHGDDNVMLGSQASLKGSQAAALINSAVVVGAHAEAHKSDTVALGSKAKAEHDNSVALGHASLTDDADQIDEAVITTQVAGNPATSFETKYSGFAGTAKGVVSVGSVGAERQIINVAPGAITALSTDAINGSQLFSVATGIKQDIYIQGDSVAGALGGNSKYEGGKVNASLEVGGNTYTNVQDALDNIGTVGGWTLGSQDATGAAQDLAVDAGGKVNLDAGKNMQVTSEQAADGTVTTTFATKADVEFDSVTTGDTVMNTDGLIVKVDDGKGGLKDGPSITKTGINAGDLNITNVKAGTADTHGVNVSQLQGVANVIGGVTVDNDGKYTGPTFKVNNTTNTTIAGAIAELDKGWTFTAGGETDQVQAGDKVSLEAGKNMLITSTKDADGNIISTFLTKDAVEFDSVKTGDSLLNNTGLTVGANVSVTNQGFTAGDVSLTVDGINAGNQTITNVAPGEISDTSLEAINGSQLHQTNTNVANNTTNITKNSGDITILQQGWTLSDGTVAGTTQVQAGDRIAIQGGDNIDVTLDATSGEMVVKTNPNVTHTSVTTGDTVMNDNGLTVGTNVSVTNQGFTAGDVSLTVDGINAGNKKITNVAAGEISDTSLEAINGSQLNATNNRVTVNEGDITTLKQGWTLSDGTKTQNVQAGATAVIKAGDNMEVAFDTNGDMIVKTKDAVSFITVTTGETVMSTDGLTVGAASGNQATITNQGFKTGDVVINHNSINAGGNKINNVQAGTEQMDAVNVSQLETVAATAGQGWYLKVNGVEADRANVAPGETMGLTAGKNMVLNQTGTSVEFTTKDEVDFTTVTTGDTVMNTDGVTILGGPSITKTGINAGDLNITNVKAGTADTHGVNVSQLQGVANVIGGVTVDIDGNYTGPTFKVNNTTNTTIAGAIAELDKGWTLSDGTVAGTTQVQAGDRIAIQGGDNIDVTLDAASGEMVVKTNPNVTHTSVTTGDTVMNTGGLTVGAAGNQTFITNQGLQVGDTFVTNGGLTFNNSSVAVTAGGINAGGQQIKDVQAGVAGTDAVNVSQLEKVEAQANKGWKLGSKDVTNTNDVTLDVAPDGKVNLDAGKNMQVTSEQAADGTVTTTFTTKADVKFDSVTTGDTVMNNNGLTVKVDDGAGGLKDGPSITKTGINAGNQTITNVAAGAISDTSLEAINGSQLNATNNRVTVNEGNISSLDGRVTVNEGDITTLKQGWTLSDGKVGKTQVQAGDTAIIKAGDNMDVTIDDVTGEMIVKTQADVNFNSVTLGDITKPDQYTQLTQGGLNIGGNTFVNNGGLTFNNSAVSVSANGVNAGGNKIINVAKGEDDSDAVNVGQLKDYVGKNDGSWKISDGTTESTVKTGNTVTIAGSKTGTTAGNIKVTHDGNGNLTIESNADVQHDNVTVGETTINKDTGITVGGTNINNEGDITVGDKVSVNKGGVTVGDVSITVDGGINAGGTKITGVADGTIAAGSTDAVNGGQIHDMQVEIDKQAGGWELNDGKGKKQQVKAGDSVSIVGGDNINVEFDADGKMVVETTPDVTHNSVNIESTDANGDIVKGPSMNKDGIDAAGNKVTGVADGEIAEGSKDAVNGGQLKDTNIRVTKNEGDINNLKTGQDGMFQVSQDYNAPKPQPEGEKSVAGGAGAVASGNNSAAIGNDSKAEGTNSTAIGNDSKATADNSTALGNSASASHNNSVALGNGSKTDRDNSVSVGTADKNRQITNVAAGVEQTDAVNVSQLDALGSKVNQYFNAANKRIDKVDNNARAGIAAAMAAGTLPQSTLPGKSMVTVGASTYRGESALAIGVSRLSDNARTVIKANASTDSRGNAGAAVGAGWHW